MKKYLEVAKIVGVHGLKGQLRLKPWCDTPEFLCGFKKLYSEDGKETYSITSSYPHKNVVVVVIPGIDTIEKAEQLRNKILYINRDDVEMEDGVYFIQDLIGLEVIDNDTGEVYGKLTDVFETGANDVYQITSKDNKDYLIPAIEKVILKTDIENKRMLICPIKGIFDDEN